MRVAHKLPPAYLFALLVIPAAVVPASAQFRKGFAQSTIEVVVNRRRPAKVVLIGTAIKVEVVSQAGQNDNLAQRFATTLETQLFANDTRLRSESASPETVVFCTINRLDTSQTAGQRQVQVSRQTGTKQVYNEKKKTNETEPVYSMVNETQTFTTVRGDIAVAIQVRDRKTGATIDSQTLSPTYNTEIPAGTTPPDKNQVEQWLIDRAVLQEVQRLTPTREPIKVLLARPNDQIDDLNGLAKAGLWSRMLEQLELTKPLPDPKKEAYRLYNIGLANEALAYGTDDLDTSRKLLEQASALYGKALEMKPDEKYFREPQTRIADGITAYAELDRQRTLIAAAAAKAQAAPTPVEAEGSRSLSGPASEPGVLTNRDVIELVKTGIDEANLNATIREAKRVSFDLSPAGLKQLLTEKVSNSIIALMRAKQNGAPKATSAKRKP